jgi:hypothetical protein
MILTIHSWSSISFGVGRKAGSTRKLEGRCQNEGTREGAGEGSARLFDEVLHGIAPAYFCFVFKLRWLDVKKAA